MIRYITNLFKQMSFGRNDLKAILYNKKILKKLFTFEKINVFFGKPYDIFLRKRFVLK